MKFEELIIKCGFSPLSFYKTVNLDRQLIYNYRKGISKPSSENLIKIANSLNVSTDVVYACFK